MAKTVAETIKEITRQHLKSGGAAMGQCLSAVGWVGGTVPDMTEKEGLLELSMDDTSGSGIAVGYALGGRRPIFICQYQGFMHIGASQLLNYAAKSKDLWKIPCPVFIRSIAMEGAIGPVAGSSHHGMMTRMPGLTVCAPMTPKEYEHVWKTFVEKDDPFYVSEHRRSFKIDYEMPDELFYPEPDITLFPISAARLSAIEAADMLSHEGILCNIVHLLWLKPFVVLPGILNAVGASKYGGIVIDTDFENGVSKSIACDIMQHASRKVRVLGLEERTAGFAPHLDNLPPSPEKICNFVKNIIQNR